MPRRPNKHSPEVLVARNERLWDNLDSASDGGRDIWGGRDMHLADLDWCPHCNASHAKLKWFRFPQAALGGDGYLGEWHFWAVCPTSANPVIKGPEGQDNTNSPQDMKGTRKKKA